MHTPWSGYFSHSPAIMTHCRGSTKNMSRPAIPEEIKRLVRQRCRFGCVICGIPLFHYDHIEDFAEVLKHEENNITLLCPNHHQMKTSKRLSKELLLERDAKPFNAERERTAKYAIGLVSAGPYAKFFAGGNSYIFDIVPGKLCPCITIDGVVVIGLTVEDGALLFDFELHNSTGTAAIISKLGEVCVSTGNWDYRLEGATCSIRSAPDDIIVEIEYGLDSIWLKRGLFIGPKGTSLEISETQARIGNGRWLVGFNTFVNTGMAA